jgi:putative hydrolase of the HAD superfamily
MNTAQAICLDLDDTLWDLRPVIPRAERTLYDWYGEHYPDVLKVYTPKDVLELRQKTALGNPQLRHDLTALRLMVLGKIAVDAGYAESMAKEAFEVFDRARNDVELFADVLPALERLGSRYRLLTLSNGNANLQIMGIAHYFSQSYSARELGVAKPEAAIFHAVCERENLAPEQILHVGDHPENDIVAACTAGMIAVWVNREGKEWPLEGECPVDTVACLEELASTLGV